jgi:hypothetical protein
MMHFFGFDFRLTGNFSGDSGIVLIKPPAEYLISGTISAGWYSLVGL